MKTSTKALLIVLLVAILAGAGLLIWGLKTGKLKSSADTIQYLGRIQGIASYTDLNGNIVGGVPSITIQAINANGTVVGQSTTATGGGRVPYPAGYFVISSLPINYSSDTKITLHALSSYTAAGVEYKADDKSVTFPTGTNFLSSQTLLFHVPYGTISGQAYYVDGSGNSIGLSNITIEATTNGFGTSGQTGQNGVFTISRLPLNISTSFVVHATGCVTLIRTYCAGDQTVTFPAGQTTTNTSLLFSSPTAPVN